MDWWTGAYPCGTGFRSSCSAKDFGKFLSKEEIVLRRISGVSDY